MSTENNHKFHFEILDENNSKRIWYTNNLKDAKVMLDSMIINSEYSSENDLNLNSPGKKLTIEEAKEREEGANLMKGKEVFEPMEIEEKAEAYADSVDRRGCSFWRGLKLGYIAGYTQKFTDKTELIDQL